MPHLRFNRQASLRRDCVGWQCDENSCLNRSCIGWDSVGRNSPCSQFRCPCDCPEWRHYLGRREVLAIGYAYRVPITVPQGAVGENLTDFVLGIVATLDTCTVYSGTDFLCTDTTGATLDHELRDYDSTSGQIHIFVKTDLDASADNTMYLYSGKA